MNDLNLAVSLKMAMSKVMCASNISKDCLPEPECYTEKSITLVIENLNPKNSYGLPGLNLQKLLMLIT